LKKIVNKVFLIGSTFLLVLTSAVALSNSLGLDLRARVSLSCSLSAIKAIETNAGTQLQIKTRCNSRQFRINLSNDTTVDIETVAFSGATTGIVTYDEQQVLVQPRLPGTQYLTVDVNNKIGSLRNLSVSVTAK